MTFAAVVTGGHDSKIDSFSLMNTDTRLPRTRPAVSASVPSWCRTRVSRVRKNRVAFVHGRDEKLVSSTTNMAGTESWAMTMGAREVIVPV